MTPPREVLGRYPGLPGRVVWHPLANAGFSGAQLWRGEHDGVPLFALKRFPKDYPLERLRQIHGWIHHARHLPFTPAIFPTESHETGLEHDGDCWEVVGWMPGEVTTPEAMTEQKLRSASAAIIELHDAWKPVRPITQPSLAVRRRLRLLEEWRGSDPPRQFAPLWLEADAVLRKAVPTALNELETVANEPMLQQPILADIHGEHVLFTEDTVTGIIDYGAMKVDSVAVDAARYLGDACGENESLYNLGCQLFAERGCSRERIELFDRTGTLGALANWLIRRDPSPRVEARMTKLLRHWRWLAGRNGTMAS